MVASIDLAIYELELCNLTFGLSVRPWLDQGSLLRSQISGDAFPATRLLGG